MNQAVIRSTLAAAGVELSNPSNGRLRFRAPTGAYTADLRALVDRHRKELLFCMCWHCGSTEFCDVPIHDGQSTRRDCAQCRRFICFPIWYGQNNLVDHNGGSKTAQA